MIVNGSQLALALGTRWKLRGWLFILSFLCGAWLLSIPVHMLTKGSSLRIEKAFCGECLIICLPNNDGANLHAGEKHWLSKSALDVTALG